MDFPRLVYKSASNHKLVNTPDEYGAAMRAGWFGSVPEAAKGVASTPAPVATKVPEQLTGSPPPAAPVLTVKEKKAAEKAAKAAASATPPAPVAPTEEPAPAAAVKQPWD